MKGKEYDITSSGNQPTNDGAKKSLAIRNHLSIYPICWTCQQKCDHFGEYSRLTFHAVLSAGFHTSIDVFAELDNGTQVIIEIYIIRIFSSIACRLICSQVNQILKKFANGRQYTSKLQTSHLFAIAILWIVIISR